MEALKHKLTNIGNVEQKQTDVGMNFNILQKSIDAKTKYLNDVYYYKSSYTPEPPEVKTLTDLQAIHNLFTILNERIDRLERIINKST